MSIDEEITRNKLIQILGVISEEAEKEGFDDYWFFGQLLNGDFIIKSFFEKYFKKTEGVACCCDKAEYVLKAIKAMVEKKENISLQQTYREYKENRGDIGNIKELDEICYWCPKTIKNSKEAIELFYKETIMEVPQIREKVLYIIKRQQEKIDRAIKYIRSNEWATDYEKSSCRTRLLEILETNEKYDRHILKELTTEDF
ncbi:MAG: hypothetical protein IJH12_06980 [Clostridia bacterium]|nr:hypothetical protein [Clostridia bacterium]